jgi:hypothetical protein
MSINCASVREMDSALLTFDEAPTMTYKDASTQTIRICCVPEQSAITAGDHKLLRSRPRLIWTARSDFWHSTVWLLAQDRAGIYRETNSRDISFEKAVSCVSRRQRFQARRTKNEKNLFLEARWSCHSQDRPSALAGSHLAGHWLGMPTVAASNTRATFFLLECRP